MKTLRSRNPEMVQCNLKEPRIRLLNPMLQRSKNRIKLVPESMTLQALMQRVIPVTQHRNLDAPLLQRTHRRKRIVKQLKRLRRWPKNLLLANQMQLQSIVTRESQSPKPIIHLLNPKLSPSQEVALLVHPPKLWHLGQKQLQIPLRRPFGKLDPRDARAPNRKRMRLPIRPNQRIGTIKRDKFWDQRTNLPPQASE